MESTTHDEGPISHDDIERKFWHLPAWLQGSQIPSFEVIDTRSAQGRLDPVPKLVSLTDLVLFHGHACDGLLRGVWAMRALADVVFPDQPFDRSDLLVVSKNSPCLGDLAAYLTGARARFGTHRLDDTLGVGFLVQSLSTGEAWEVREERGFFPELIAKWEAMLLRDELTSDEKAELLAVHEAAQWDWVRRALLPSSPSEHYHVKHLDQLSPPPPIHEARRTDTVNRTVAPPRVVTTRYEPDLDSDVPVDPLPEAWVRRYNDGPQLLS
ncbi:formylmethanofuran dehydrogenase subunit E family protein [Ferrimicrobium sp.]|uniref:formylmethanofuran dehydrogenase subunit E family protein n=1 Tax=Ferrimicrobium sp. TaxID=2926050 RepID=UPI002616498D|nr:formylmethanofuran dehydrogenase subunit E family protein [Ferrimicrobium sp.]